MAQEAVRIHLVGGLFDFRRRLMPLVQAALNIRLTSGGVVRCKGASNVTDFRRCVAELCGLRIGQVLLATSAEALGQAGAPRSGESRLLGAGARSVDPDSSIFVAVRPRGPEEEPHFPEDLLQLQRSLSPGNANVRWNWRRGSPSPDIPMGVPLGVGLHDWIALQTFCCFQDAARTAYELEGLCTRESCPRMCAGRLCRYSWADPSTPEPLALSAPDYMGTLIPFARGALERLMASRRDQSFAEEKMLLKRFFRVYAHAFLDHFEDIHAGGGNVDWTCRLLHFDCFVRRFDLVSDADMAPLLPLVQKLKPGPRQGRGIRASAAARR